LQQQVAKAVAKLRDGPKRRTPRPFKGKGGARVNPTKPPRGQRNKQRKPVAKKRRSKLYNDTRKKAQKQKNLRKGRK
jgi:hypothetical protein